MQIHRCLHPVEMPVGEIQILGVHLHEFQIIRPQRLRPRMTIAQARRRGIDRDDFAIGKRQRQRHDIMPNGASQIENAPGHPSRPFALDPVDQRLPAAVAQRAQPAARRREDAAIIIRPRRHVARAFLAMIAARHTVNVDSSLITRHRNLRVQHQRLAPLIILPRPRIEFVELAQHHRPSVLLAHFHRIALQCGPVAVPRIAVHRRANFKPVLRHAAMFGPEGREDTIVIGKLVARTQPRQRLVQIGEKVEPRRFVMADFGEYTVAFDGGIGGRDIGRGHINPSLASRSSVSACTRLKWSRSGILTTPPSIRALAC